MLAAAEYTNCCTKPKIYENDWINNHRRRISWLNFLTVQPIPEETDVIDCPKHIRNNSDSSSSSIEDCYIVLEVQRPRLTDEQLNFAQINEDKHNVEYEQFAEPIIIEVPLQRNTVEHQSEQMLINKEHVKVTEVHIHEPKKPDKSVLMSKDDPPNFTNEQHHCPITNLSSTENKTHISNSIQIQQEKSTLETTTTLTRIFTFDRTCMEKSDRAKEQEINDNETHIKEQSVLPFDLDKVNNLPNPSTFFRLIKKHTRTIKSGYYLHDDKMKINEPTLLQVKYVDGRQTLTDLNALESMQKFQLNLLKNSYKQDLSYRKRILNRVQSFLKSTNSNEQSIPWQQKTVLELYYERKNKVNRY